MSNMMVRWQSRRLCPRCVLLIDVRYVGLKGKALYFTIRAGHTRSCQVSLTQLGGFVWGRWREGDVILSVQLFCKPRDQRNVFAWCFCALPWRYAYTTSPLQYWSNYPKLLMEELQLQSLNCFLGKCSEDALWGQAFCQVSYSPVAGIPWRRRGRQGSPHHSSTENMGRQTNGSMFHVPCVISLPLSNRVSALIAVLRREGNCG